MMNDIMKKEFCNLRDSIIEALYKHLNDEQRKAVLTISGPLLILAGAGSGKTSVLVNRIANLLSYGPAYGSSYFNCSANEDDLKNMEKEYQEIKNGLRKKVSDRTAELISGTKVYPSQILAITFTNKAAGEMKERVRKIIGEEADNMWVSTFHSSCVRILRREIDKLGYNKNFGIYDSYDQKVLIKQCMEELKINDKDITEREIINKISEQKDNLISSERFKRENENNFRLNKIADVYVLYTKKLKNNNSLDFDDLIYKTVELFKASPEVLEFYQRKFKYVMVDEYQDTNKAQYEFTRLLAAGSKNICVVGDDDQAIYGWRGADVRNILDFEKDYPSSKVIKLEQNYRSVGNILQAANDVIQNNTERKFKVLRTDSSAGEKIKIFRGYSEAEEASFIAGEINRLCRDEEKKFGSFSVLYRTNAQSRVFETTFMKMNIPYRIIGGLKFYDRKEIKDIMAYLKLINNPLDDLSFIRIINVPKRSIGGATVTKLQQFADQMEESLYNTIQDLETMPGLTARIVTSVKKFAELLMSFIKVKDTMAVSELIKKILNDTGYLKELKMSTDVEDQSRIENLEELVSAAVEFENNSEEKSLSAFLESVTLVSDIDKLDDEADAVVMMTVHSAKGLEFPVVFMAGMENGIFPGSQSLNDPSEMQESRRLCYVGITRAKEKLYMTSAESRNVFGRFVSFTQSDFVSEINPALKEVVGGGKAAANNLKNFQKSYADSEEYTSSYIDNRLEEIFGKTDESLLLQEECKMGVKVKHSKFGIGTIVSVSKDSGGVKLVIAFDNMGVKNLMFNMAKLQKV